MKDQDIPYCLVLGYGQQDNGEIDEQTKGRCWAASELYRNTVGRLYITTACEKAGMKMANDMKRALIKFGVHEGDIIVQPSATNTTGEIQVFLSLVERNREVYAVSSWYHIPRIVWLFATRGRLVGVGWTWVCSWADLKIEPIKLLKDILCFGRNAKIKKIIE